MGEHDFEEDAESARAARFVLRLPRAGDLGWMVERHGAPSRNIHALQLEIDRRCYLDKQLRSPGSDFDAMAAFVDALVLELGEALLRGQFATAAE